jgi:hypothetical protein
MELFKQLVTALYLAKGRTLNAASIAKANRYDERVQLVLEMDVMKAAVSGGMLSGDSTWATPLAALRTISNSWFQTLRSISLLDALLTACKRIPPNIRYGITTAVGTGSTIQESKWVKLTEFGFDNSNMSPQKALSMVVVTDELMRYSGIDQTGALLESELRGVVALACDQTVVAALLDGVTPINSVGDARHDLRVALDAVPLTQASKPFILTSPNQVKQLGLLGLTDAAPAFPDVTIPTGGSISGMPLLGCDVLNQYDSGGDVLIVCDASQIAADAGVIELDASNSASLQMSDSPTDAAADVVNLYQTGSTALRARRDFNFQRIRSSCVALIDGVNYAPAVGSP